MVVTLTQDDATVLARQLVEAIRLGYVARGVPPPRLLLDFANEVSSSARFRSSSQVTPTPGTAGFRAELFKAVSDQQPARLTVEDAARLAEVSEGFMRRCCRRGDVEASRGHRGAWLVDASSLAVWIDRRRKELDRKAA